jgi:peptide methionine sulfoxide reductase MsrA
VTPLRRRPVPGSVRQETAIPRRCSSRVTNNAKRQGTIADVEASALWPGKIVTEVTLAGPFWEAEPERKTYFRASSERLHVSFHSA